MAGFSLGGGSGGGGDEEAPESLFQLYGGSGSASGTSRGFELWQQHQMQRQQQQHHPQLYSSTMLGFSSDQSHHHHHHQLAGSSSGSRGPAVRGSSSGGMSCQDCGNQSKKDCSHMRCRTCCKSRGFQCPTHVKSTWVAAAKRRDRQQQLTAAAAAQPPSSSQQQHREQPQRLIEASKRPRELSTRRLPTAIATAASGGMETAMSFPSEVSSPAVFRCVRVSPMDEADDEYAYQTAVSIGGHVFKGILYDQGQESQYHHHHHHHSASADATAITTIGVGVGGASSSAAAVSAGLVNIDPSTLYPTPLSAFVAGTQFFPHHPRP